MDAKPVGRPPSGFRGSSFALRSLARHVLLRLEAIEGLGIVSIRQIAPELFVLRRAGAVVDDLVDLDGVVIRAGLHALHAVVADLVGIQIAHAAFAAVVAQFGLVQHAVFRHRISPLARSARHEMFPLYHRARKTQGKSIIIKNN